ncbi:ParB/Srx family N-terminal domain-containing protein [bacterium]|nr:ParB/Srx family N-terminal domain-containing protein [bacterium]
MPQIEMISTADLAPYKSNPKQHTTTQVGLIAKSIQEFGFIAPVIIDADNTILAGHGRVMAAELLKMDEVPCVRFDHLTEAQRRAYVLADNRLTELGDWDLKLVETELKLLSEDEFDLELTGFGDDDLSLGDDEKTEQMPKTKECPACGHVW